MAQQPFDSTQTEYLLTAIGSATDFVNALLRGALDDGGQEVHGMWYSLKEQELYSQKHPFLGAIPVGSRFVGMYRVRLSDLTVEEKNTLIPFLLRSDPEMEKKDVYHSLFVHQSELLKSDPNAARMNRVPVATVLVGLADMFSKVNVFMFKQQIQEMLQLASKENWTPEGVLISEKVSSALSGESLEKRKKQLDQLVRLVHAGWVAAVIATGKTPEEDANIAVYDELDGWMTQYDKDIAIVLLKWIVNKIDEVHSKKI